MEGVLDAKYLSLSLLVGLEACFLSAVPMPHLFVYKKLLKQVIAAPPA